MDIDPSQPFTSALADVGRRSILPTSLSSEELAAIDVRIRALSIFSARVTNATILEGIDSGLARLVRGTSTGPGDHFDPATFRLELKQLLASVNYAPADPHDEGTLKDLRTDQRLNLIVRTNEEMATGYGQFIESTDPEVLDLYPAWELVRVRPSKAERDWARRWSEAAAAVGDTGAQAAQLHGRMAARKDSPIWVQLSRFGTPHPPFDFNSGMGVDDVERADAIELGLIQRGDKVAAPDHPSDLAPTAKVGNLSRGIRDSLLASLGPKYRVDGDGVLHLAGGAAPEIP